MPTIRDDAICVRRWDFSETSQTVSLLARETGLVRGIVKGAKRQRSPFAGGIDLLACGELVAIVKPGRDLATVTAWDPRETFGVLRRDLAANRAGLYMADLVHHMLSEQDPHPRVYDALLAALREPDDPARVAAALLRFEWRLLGETGYEPRLDRDAQTGGPLPSEGRTLAFSAAAGGVVADTGTGDRWRVRRKTVELLRAVSCGTSTEGMTPADFDRANRLLAAYIRELLGAEPHAMRWAFPDLAARSPAC